MLVVCPSCRRHARGTEGACPHCALPGAPTLLALVASLGLGLAGCEPSSADRPVEQPDGEPGSAQATAPPKESPREPIVAVYGPPPIRPDLRVPETSATATATATIEPPPSAAPAAPPKFPPAKVYGPPPRDPNQR